MLTILFIPAENAPTLPVMTNPLRSSRGSAALALVALLPFGVAAYHCGSKPPSTPTGATSGPSSVAGMDNGSATPSSGDDSTAPPASTAAEIPPPPASTGSKKAQAKNDPSWATCHQSYQATSKDKNLPG